MGSASGVWSMRGPAAAPKRPHVLESVSKHGTVYSTAVLAPARRLPPPAQHTADAPAQQLPPGGMDALRRLSHAQASTSSTARTGSSLHRHHQPQQLQPPGLTPGDAADCVDQLERLASGSGGPAGDLLAAALCGELAPCLPALPPHGLLRLAGAVARLQLQLPQQWQQRFLDACRLHFGQPGGLQARLGSTQALSSSEICQLLRAVAGCGWQPGAAWVEACLSGWCSDGCGDAEVAATAVHLLRLLAPREKLPPAWLRRFWSATQQRAGSMKGHEAVLLMRGVADWRTAVPESWQCSMLAAVLAAAPTLPAADVGTAADALWRLTRPQQGQRQVHPPSQRQRQQQPDAPPQAQLQQLQRRVRDALQQRGQLVGADLEPASAAQLLFAMARLHQQPQPAWTESLLHETRARLPDFSPRHLSTALSTAASLGAAPSAAWLSSFYDAAAQQLHRFGCEDVTATLCALARLGQVPAACWTEGLLVRTHALLPAMTHHQLAGVAWALGRLSLLPSPAGDSIALVPSQPWLDSLYHQAGARLAHGEAFDARQLVRLLWAASAMRHHPGAEFMAAVDVRLLRLASAAAKEQRRLWRAQPPADSASSGGGGGSSAGGGSVAAAAAAPVGAARPAQELPVHMTALLLHAWALLRHKPGAALLDALLLSSCAARQLRATRPADVVMLLHRLSQLQPAQPRARLKAALQPLQHHLGSLSPDALAQLLAACARCSHPPHPQWAHSYLAATQPVLRHMSPRSLSTLMWALGRLQLQPSSAWMEEALEAMRKLLPGAEAGSLALTLGALARLQYRPQADWLGAVLMASHRQAATTDAHSSLVMLWALGRLRLPPAPRWLKAQLLLLHKQLPLLGTRGVSVLLVSLARVRVRPSAVFLRRLLSAGGDWGGASAQDVHNVVWALAVLDWRPDDGSLPALGSAVAARLQDMTPQGVACTLWAAAKLHLGPEAGSEVGADAARGAAWQAAVAAVLLRSLPAMSAAQLWVSAWAAARLGPQPAAPGASTASSDPAQRQQQEERQRLLGAGLAQRAAQLQGGFTPKQLAGLLYAMARLGVCPGQAWLEAAVGANGCAHPGALSGNVLALLLWSLGTLGYACSPAWLAAAETQLEVAWVDGVGRRHMAQRGLALLRLLEAPTCEQPAAALGGGC